MDGWIIFDMMLCTWCKLRSPRTTTRTGWQAEGRQAGRLWVGSLGGLAGVPCKQKQTLYTITTNASWFPQRVAVAAAAEAIAILSILQSYGHHIAWLGWLLWDVMPYFSLVFCYCVLYLSPFVHETLIYATANLLSRVFTGYVSLPIRSDLYHRTEDFSNTCCPGLEYVSKLCMYCKEQPLIQQ